jgi:hypothetical protein
VDSRDPDPQSSRSLGPAFVAEVLARASFGEKQPDAPSEATLVRDRERGPPALVLPSFEEAFASVLQPLTFRVVTRAPSKRLRARFIGSSAAFSPTGLIMREMLSGVDPCDQSRADIALFRRRCCSRLGTPSVVPRTPRSVVRRSMFPNPVVHARSETPRTRSLLQSRFPRQLVKADSVPLELDPPPSRIFRCRGTNEPEMRLVDVCNPHVKDEHP